MGFQRLQEIASKDDNKETFKQTLEMLQKGYFDYDEVNLFGTGTLQEEWRTNPLKQAEADEFKKFIKETPFRTIAKEFLAQSGTTGIAGD